MVLDASRPKRCLAYPFVLLLMAGCVTTESNPSPRVPPPDGTVKKYIITLEGRNFMLRSGGKPNRYGFTTTRDVEATNPEEATRSAIQSVRDDTELYGAVLNDPSDPPRVTATDYIEVQSFESNRRPDLDYIFYADHDTR